MKLSKQLNVIWVKYIFVLLMTQQLTPLCNFRVYYYNTVRVYYNQDAEFTGIKSVVLNEYRRNCFIQLW